MVETLTPPTPTVAAFQLRFPEFAAADPALVQFALDEANVFIGSVAMTARVMAQMYLAAHIMSLNQFAADNDGLDVSGETIGRISIHYRGPWSRDAEGDLMMTVYGRRYKAFRELGISKFKVVGGSQHRHGVPAGVYWWW